MNPMARLLIIDDDKALCEALTELARSKGLAPQCAFGPAEGRRMAHASDCDVVLLDLDFPDGNGLDILPDLLKAPSGPEVIIMTGTGGVRGAELAYKHGAWDYVLKPFQFDEVFLPISRALQYRREKNRDVPPKLLKRNAILGGSPELEQCLELVAAASATDTSVLISGETGTGKDLFAHAIHANSRRSNRPFIAVDCAALPGSLVEGTLFGHEKGAFTGAERRREGLIREADGGVLFLDEIGELPLAVQATFLRTLQERRLRPIGGKTEVPVDFRLVSATNRDLDEMVETGQFRRDLLFRIRTIEIAIPPLRRRPGDVRVIAMGKIDDLCRRHELPAKGASPEFMEILEAHPWPGNVRELVNVLEYALALAPRDAILYPKHLPSDYRLVKLKADAARQEPEPESGRRPAEDPFPTLPEYKDRAEREYLRALLDRAGGDRETACRLSGVSQSRLYHLLKKQGLPRFRS